MTGECQLRASSLSSFRSRASELFSRNIQPQSSGSTLTIRWSWLLPTQNVTGVVELSTNTVRMLVSDGIRYCTALPVLGSTRTTRSVCIVDAQISPFLSTLALYG